MPRLCSVAVAEAGASGRLKPEAYILTRNFHDCRYLTGRPGDCRIGRNSTWYHRLSGVDEIEHQTAPTDFRRPTGSVRFSTEEGADLWRDKGNQRDRRQGMGPSTSPFGSSIDGDAASCAGLPAGADGCRSVQQS